MIVVGLVSSYKEGRLLRGALDSIERVGLDKLYVYEGPAGDPIEGDLPESDFGDRKMTGRFGNFHFRKGRWRSDAKKRQHMLEHVKQDYPGQPVWGVILDADEVLVNGEYLRDILQWVEWENERDKTPWFRWPLRIIEGDGSVAFVGSRVIRLDMLARYIVSSGMVENVHGVREGHGNVGVPSEIWIRHFLGAMDKGKMVAWPPLPCEPHIFHRSGLRHPLRRGNRLHHQEAVELQREGG